VSLKLAPRKLENLGGAMQNVNLENIELSSSDLFDIRDHIEKLTPAKGANRYECPACEGHNLSIEPKTGKYQCWNGCECKTIREAIAPWEEKVGVSEPNNQAKASQSKQGKPKPVPIPAGAKLLLLPEPATDIPESEPTTTKLPKGIPGRSHLTTYNYSPTQWVIRYEWTDPEHKKGRDKTFRQWSRLPDGTPSMTKGDKPWFAYRLDEVVHLLETNEGISAVLWQEGEKCVEIARAGGIASLSMQGSAWRKEDIKRTLQTLLSMRPQTVQVLLADDDETGRKKASTFSNACLEIGLPCVIVYPDAICDDLQDDTNDIEQILRAMDIKEFIERLEAQIHVAVDNNEPTIIDEFADISDAPINPNVSFTQKAFNLLYGDKHWISADDKLYFWTGNHYKHSPDSIERSRITHFCNRFIVFKKGKITYPYAKPAKVREALQWVKDMVEIDNKKLNPPGINCTNGIVRIDWVNNKPTPRLDPHTPDDYFTYEPLIAYDPIADSSECDRLLACLDPAQQQVLLRNLAASIDLENVRRLKGREVRVLLASGLGSNGKDSLREVVSIIYGNQGITSVSLADFAAYDDGRKFALAPLIHSRVNWASENPQTARLDKIQALKLFATGNKLHHERKGKDHIEFDPVAVGLFNVNEAPALQGTIQAIKDRIAVLEFRKTFTKFPDPNNPNELLADPRFAYDKEFVRLVVAPAFLNKMLQALAALIDEGINYESTSEAFSNLQKENNHLFQFCEDVGLTLMPNSVMTANEIWSLLEQWYIDNGTLTIDEDGRRRTWLDQVRPSDKNIKGTNQVIPRILSLFPKAKKVTTPHPIYGAKRPIAAIQGLGIAYPSDFSLNENSTPIIENNTPIPHPVNTPNNPYTANIAHPPHSVLKIVEENEKNKNKQNNLEQQNEQKIIKKEYPPQSGQSGCATPENTSKLGVPSGCVTHSTERASGCANSESTLSVLNEGQIHQNFTLSQQIVANWDKKQELGQIILAAAESIELKAIASGFNPEQLRHIKDAANQAWKPNCNSCGEYCGEKVELWEFGDKRDWKVRSASGSIIPAARGNVYPWLGI
jgi:putative DNA primase/helicase